MVMKRAIAGVSKNKKSRGDIIEMTPEDKVELAVKDAMAHHSKWFPNWGQKLAWCTKLKISDSRYSAKGNLLKKRYANNSYTARGSLMAHLQEGHSIFEPRLREFEITFCDCLDDNGIPDLTVEKFKITPL